MRFKETSKGLELPLKSVESSGDVLCHGQCEQVKMSYVVMTLNIFFCDCVFSSHLLLDK